jgi:hypothetical protein
MASTLCWPAVSRTPLHASDPFQQPWYKLLYQLYQPIHPLSLLLFLLS